VQVDEELVDAEQVAQLVLPTVRSVLLRGGRAEGRSGSV
jgi:hypothetical protein